MGKIMGNLTVFFEEPFWVGVHERRSQGKIAVCKIIFGSEPKDEEVYFFLLGNWNNLKFSEGISFEERKKYQTNHKRRQRDDRKIMLAHGVGTKAQEAIRKQQEERKKEKKKKKHRGR